MPSNLAVRLHHPYDHQITHVVPFRPQGRDCPVSSDSCYLVLTPSANDDLIFHPQNLSPFWDLITITLEIFLTHTLNSSHLLLYHVQLNDMLT